ncbi:hypothetical protein MED01_004236 [Micromonospora sp. MED01]|uniref:hypothetical protein n=1 Tax=Micromonospora alfalfae TaxID=2911212 RepID=UPI001EE855A6|nr:hypothetical protein [Micromonospora alfalfae]MCG5460810.1 hypothetical protein [Micromonospora alfalfae]
MNEDSYEQRIQRAIHDHLTGFTWYDTDNRGDIEIHVLDSNAERRWYAIGPSGAVSITARHRPDGPLPAGAITEWGGAFIFPTRLMLTHRPDTAGAYCPITGGGCTHTDGSPLGEPLDRCWDSDSAFDGAMTDDLAGEYRRVHGHDLQEATR